MLLFAMVAFTACKKDGTTDERLTGKWQLESSHVTIGNDISETVTLPTSLRSSLTFNADGSAILEDWNLVNPGTTAERQTVRYTLSSDGKTLTITHDNIGVFTYIVKELSANRLVLEFQTNLEELGNVKVVYTLKKV